ncbi:MAG: hypothetical protein B7X10_02630, partial [Burkholderiales bacterium 21-58-4]
ITFKDKPSRADIAVREGDVLFARMKGTKKVLRVTQELADVIVSTGFAVLRPGEDCDPAYLAAYLSTDYFERQKEKYCSGAIQPAITNGGIEKLQIPLPPLNDQIRIAHLLGKVAGLIAQRKQHLQQLDDLLKSVFLEMFGDPILNPNGFPVRRLSEFYVNPKEGTKCGPFGSALKKEELVDSGVPVWNMDNIAADGHMALPFRMWITKDKFEDLAAYSVQDGDIIISRAGTVGKMCVAYTNGEPAIISTNLIRLRLGSNLRPLHFVSLMLYCKGRVGRLKTGADGAFTHMNTGVLDSLEFPYPPIELQDQFGAIFGKVESIRARYRQSLADLEDLYGALSQKAFKGELDLSRMPLPRQVEEVPNLTIRATGESTISVSFLLPAPKDPEWLTVGNRQKLIEFWLTAWCEHYVEVPFEASKFLDAAYQQLVELTERNSFQFDKPGKGLDEAKWYEEPAPFGIDEYDQIKKWVFDALAAGKLNQVFQNNQIALL